MALQNDPPKLLPKMSPEMTSQFSNCEMTWMVDYIETFGQHIRSLRQVTCQDIENQTHNIIELDLPECSVSGPLPSSDPDRANEGKNSIFWHLTATLPTRNTRVQS